MPDVVLRIAGHEYGGWLNISVTTSMEQLAGTFELGMTPKDPEELEQNPIKRGAPCRVIYGGKTLITGFVDTASPGLTGNTYDIQVSGRDVTCDLVDCCHIGKKQEWKNENLLTIAREVCLPFGAVTVETEVDLGGKMASAKINQGDTIHAFLLRLARQQSVIMVSYGDGRLVFTRAGKARMGVALVQGQNIKAARITGSNRDRFSEYQVKGQAPTATLNFNAPPKPGADMYDAAMKLFNESAASTAVATDPGVGRYRPMVIVSQTGSNKAEMETRAKWEAARRAGQANRATITVAGWQATPGEPWRINRLVPVDCARLDMKDDYLVESATFKLGNRNSHITELGVVHPDAYLPEPLKKGKGAAASKLDFTERK